MSSLNRSDAARANGAKSRGPVTEEGRRKVAFNAMRHGLTSATIVLSNESRERFQELFETYLMEFQPEGEIEFGFVEEMAAAKWRIRRIWGMETALLDVQMDRQVKELEQEFTTIDEGVRLALAFDASIKEANSLAQLSTHENRLSRAHDRALRNLLERQAARKAAEAAAQTDPDEASPADGEPSVSPAQPPQQPVRAFSQNEPGATAMDPSSRGPVRAEYSSNPVDRRHDARFSRR